MKTYTMDTAAAWVATIDTFQDGDVFRETNIDTMVESIGDRLGYLKTAADAAVEVGDTPTWTGLHTWAGAAAGIVITGDEGLTTGTLTCDGTSTLANLVASDAAEFQSTIDLATGNSVILWREGFGSDAAQSVSTTSDVVWVPQITANRIYTLSDVAAGKQGARIRIVRNRTADAFTLTVSRSDATVLGVISASNAGWIECMWTDFQEHWVVCGWGGTVTSLNTDVS